MEARLPPDLVQPPNETVMMMIMIIKMCYDVSVYVVIYLMANIY